MRVSSNFAPPSPTHFELKTVDGEANPDLALGVVIAAGLDGVKRGLVLGESVAVDPGNLMPAEREAPEIDLLPNCLGEAIAQFNNDEMLQSVLGSELASAFIAVRQAEWEAMQDMELEAEVKVLVERY